MIRTRRLARPSRRHRLRPMLDRLEGRALMATAGVLDPSFGGGTGASYLPIGTQTNAVQGLGGLQSVQVESDGSVVAAGAVEVNGVQTISLVHLDADGTLDTTFGTGGVADVVLPSGVSAQPLPNISDPLLIQPGTGNIIVTTNVSVGTAVAMFNPNGSPDSSFGTDGVAILNGADLPGAASFLYAAVQSDGKIVLAGVGFISTGSGFGTEEVAVARLNTDGSRDTSFSGIGAELVSSIPAADFENSTAASPVYENPAGVAIQPNGQIVILTTYRDELGTVQPETSAALIRLNADGSRDTSLSQAGIQASGVPPVFAGSPTAPVGLIVEPNGDFLALGGGKVALLDADGSLVNVAGLPSGDPASAFALLPDSDVAVVDSGGTIVARFNPNLTLDGSFGDGGIATVAVTPPGTGQAPFKLGAVAAGPDGRIVVAGANPSFSALTGQLPPTYDVVARLTATGTKATSGDFNGDGISDIALYLPAYGAFAITDSSGQTAGEIVPFGPAGPGQTIPAPGDYYGTGYDDIAAYLPAYGAYAIKDPTGKTAGTFLQFGIAGMGQTIPAPGDYYGTGQDDIAVYLTGAGVFAIQDPTGQTSGKFFQFGIPGPGQSIPVPGDYYGTGQDDIAVYLAQAGVWAIQDPTGKTAGELIAFGAPGLGVSIPVPGDYDGSGKTELAVYIPILGELIYRPANGGPDVTIPFGTPGNGNTLPAPGDYDGSGKTEVAAYLPNIGVFAYHPASGGSDVYKAIGVAGPGQTIPVTTVVPSPPPVMVLASTDAIEAESILGEPDALDFLPSVMARKPKPGDPPALA